MRLVADFDSSDPYGGLLDWLNRRALDSWDIPTLQSELVENLVQLGFSLQRMHVGVPMLHPLYVVGAYTWRPGSGVETDLYAREATTADVWRKTPMRPIYESGAEDGSVSRGSCIDSNHEPEIWLTYYATEDERRLWQDETGGSLPPTEPVPYPRQMPRRPH